MGGLGLGIFTSVAEVPWLRGLSGGLNRLLMVSGACGLAVFVGLVTVQGFTLYNIGSILNLWTMVLAGIGYAVWGQAYLAIGGYLLILVGDILAGLGYGKLPSPVAALVNLSPAFAVSAVIVFWSWTLLKYKGQIRLVLRQMWGLKYLLLLISLGILATPLYANQELHLYVLLETYWIVLLFPGLACQDLARTEKLTRFLILTSFWIFVGVFVYQIASRPFSLLPNLSSLSATEVDNVFRLGGIAYGANNSSLTFLTLLPFGLTQIWQRQGWRWVRPVAIILLAYIIYRSDTRTAWVGFVVVLLVYFSLLKEWRYGLAVASVVVVGSLFLPYVYDRLIENIVMTGGFTGTGNNLAGRVGVWSFAIRTALRSPQDWIVGVGWAGDPAPWSMLLAGGNWSTLHSLWVSVLVHSGILGVLAWLMFFAEGFLKTWRTAFKATDAQKRWMVAGIASLIGFLFFTLTANADWPQPTQMITVIVVNLWAYSRRPTFNT